VKRLTKHAQLLTAVVVVTAAVLVVGPGYQDAQVRMRSGTAWLTSTATGEATLVDGASAEVAARVPVGEPGSALSVVQHGGDALVLNQETGALSRIDTATLKVTAPNTVLPAHSEAVLKPGPDVIYGITVHSGVVTPVDPGTREVRGRPARLAESLRPDNVIVDGRGRLWTIDEKAGDLVWLDGEERRTRPAGAKAGRLAITADRPALVDPGRGTAELLSPGTGAVTRSLRTGLRDGDSIAVSGSADRSRVLIANSTRGELVVCTFDTGSCADPVRVGAPGAELGAPVEMDGHAVIPGHSTGQATIVDITTSRVVAQRQLFDRPARFELITRDGIVFFNDPTGNVAGVLDLAGNVRTITKHTEEPAAGDSPPAPDPRAKADQVAQIDHRKQKPGLKLPAPANPATPRAPAPPAPKPAASIVISPGTHGVVGERFELTMVLRPPGTATTSWTFGDDSPAVEGTTVHHVWQRPGTFTVRAVTTFGNGATTQSEAAVTVVPEGAPPSIAKIDVQRPRPVIGEAVRFSADTTGQPDRWQWIVTRPGRIAPEITATTAEFDHRFAEPGAYTVSLTITRGTRTAQWSRQFTVSLGAVEVWGNNYANQTLVPPAASSGVVAIDAGGNHCLALKADGSVIAWNENSHGQSNVPAEASSGVVAIAAGGDHSLALKADGTVVTWGRGVPGIFSVPPQAMRDVVAIAAGDSHSMVLKADGSVVAWGDPISGAASVPPAALTGVIAIGGGSGHSLALKADGTVLSWGNDHLPDMVVPPEARSGVVALDGGMGHSLARKADGSLIGWGMGHPGEHSLPPAARSGVVSASTSYYHALALKADGSVVAWGIDADGETSVPPKYHRGVLAVAAGWAFSMVLLEGLD
jgi:hypothetical protein